MWLLHAFIWYSWLHEDVKYLIIYVNALIFLGMDIILFFYFIFYAFNRIDLWWVFFMCVLIAMNMGFIGSVKSSIEKWKKKNIDIYIHDIYFIYASREWIIIGHHEFILIHVGFILIDSLVNQLILYKICIMGVCKIVDFINRWTILINVIKLCTTENV